MSAKQRNKGFTLIELVVVIAILAILAAFALPRFAQLSEQAHESSIKGTAGALSAGVALVKAQWTANGSTGAEAYVDGFGGFDFDAGQGVAANEDGWPVSTSGSPTGAATVTRCIEVWDGLLQANAPIVSSSATGAEYQVTSPGNTCVFTYLPDNGTSTITYNPAVGSVEVSIN